MPQLTPVVTQKAIFGRNSWKKNYRHPLDPEKLKIPFKERTPLRCRNFVQDSKSPETDVVCIREMLLLFACMKNTDFNEKECPDELASFQRCYEKFRVCLIILLFSFVLINFYLVLFTRLM